MDHTLFTFDHGDIILALLVYVDDIVLARNNSEACQRVKHYLDGRFRIKNLGPLKYFLGIEVARSPVSLFLCQRKYALDILSEAGLLGCKPATTPIEQNHKLAMDSRPDYDDPSRYRHLTGRLIYLTITH